MYTLPELQGPSADSPSSAINPPSVGIGIVIGFVMGLVTAAVTALVVGGIAVLKRGKRQGQWMHGIQNKP